MEVVIRDPVRRRSDGGDETRGAQQPKLMHRGGGRKVEVGR